MELSYVNQNFIYEMLLGQFNAADQYVLQDYDELDPDLLDSREDGRRLAVGYVTPTWVSRLKITDVFACNQRNAEIIRTQKPNVHTAFKAGFVNFCADDTYQTVIITDVWKVIPITLLIVLLDEMLRIAKRVYLLDTADLQLENLPIVGEHLPTGFHAESIARAGKTDVYAITRLVQQLHVEVNNL